MTRADPGSFRDPASRVVHDDDEVLRLLDARGLADWRALSSSPLLEAAVADGRLIPTVETVAPHGWAAALSHPRLPFISYPFEWTFSMLRDAAQLQLDLLEESLAHGLILKDATPYNIQFVEGRPQFIDVGSFERYRPGEPWLGYRQFCRQFLYPLMLRAWLGVPFQPWLRGDPDGPTASVMRKLLPRTRLIRPSGLLHVALQSRAESRLRGAAVRDSLAEAGFSVEMILSNLRRLRRLVESLEWEDDDETWTAYGECDHVGRDRQAKTDFLRKAIESVRPGVFLDLGTNDGHFARVAAAAGAVAVAVDGDEAVLDRLYRGLAPGERLVPVVTNLSNPSPSQGWAGTERPALFDRVAADLVLAYGLIHHLTYTSSVPPQRVVEWLAGFDAPVVVEFVSPEDPMVEHLTANKRQDELHPDRGRDDFERLIRERFSIVDSEEMSGATRVLYHLER